jgi:mannitol 2-dehydrogenase
LVATASRPDNPHHVLDMLADPVTRILSLTSTEGGYLVDDTTGVFHAMHPAIQQDSGPPGAQNGGRVCRRWSGAPPGSRRTALTVLSRDNLHGNGSVARTAFVSFARLGDQALAAWIDANVASPNGMVDRITPQTTAADRAIAGPQRSAPEYFHVEKPPVTVDLPGRWRDDVGHGVRESLAKPCSLR